MRDDSAPGRPRGFDETHMLRRIMKLFWRGGYEGVSLADIMAETGLKKGSLYAAYGDKRALYLKALAQYEADVVDSAVRFLRDKGAAPRVRLEAFLSAPIEAARGKDRSGCFLCNASADQADLDAAAKKQVANGFERLTRALVSVVIELDADLSAGEAQARARALLSVYIGLRILVRSGASTDNLYPAVFCALAMVDTCGTA